MAEIWGTEIVTRPVGTLNVWRDKEKHIVRTYYLRTRLAVLKCWSLKIHRSTNFSY